MSSVILKSSAYDVIANTSNHFGASGWKDLKGRNENSWMNGIDLMRIKFTGIFLFCWLGRLLLFRYIFLLESYFLGNFCWLTLFSFVLISYLSIFPSFVSTFLHLLPLYSFMHPEAIFSGKTWSSGGLFMEIGIF